MFSLPEPMPFLANVKIKTNNNFRVYFNATGASYGQLTIDYPTSNANLKTVYLNTNAFLEISRLQMHQVHLKW